MSALSRWLLFLALVFTSLASTAQAQAEARVAVLELGGDLSDGVLGMISDEVRSGALDALQGQPYSVMTRENTLSLITDMGLDTEVCAAEANCEVDFGRNIGASLVISGSVIEVEGTQMMTLKLFETATAKMLATDRVSASSATELIDLTKSASLNMVARGLGLQTAPAASNMAVGSFKEQGRTLSNYDSSDRIIAEFKSSPVGAMVFLDGSVLCQSTPCSKEVAQGPHTIMMQMERYRPSTVQETLVSGSVISHSLQATFARISVSTSPSGLNITVNGEPAGKTPIVDRELSPGLYKIALDEDCYKKDGEEQNLAEGEVRSFSFQARQRMAGLDIRAVDNRDNAIRAEVYVDGERVGATPNRFEVPMCARELKLVDSNGSHAKGRLDLTEDQWTILQGTLAAAGDRAGPIEEAAEHILQQHVQQAESLLSEGQCGPAGSIANRLRSEHPDNPIGQRLLGDSLLCSEEWVKAADQYDKFLEVGGRASEIASARRLIAKHLSAVTIKVLGGDGMANPDPEKLQVKLNGNHRAIDVPYQRAQPPLRGGFHVERLAPGTYEISVIPLQDGYQNGSWSGFLVVAEHTVVGITLGRDCAYFERTAKKQIVANPGFAAPHKMLAESLVCLERWGEAWQALDRHVELGGSRNRVRNLYSAASPHLGTIQVLIEPEDGFPAQRYKNVEFSTEPETQPVIFRHISRNRFEARGVVPGSIQVKVGLGEDYRGQILRDQVVAGKTIELRVPAVLRRYANLDVSRVDPELVVRLTSDDGNAQDVPGNEKMEVLIGPTMIRASMGNYKTSYEVILEEGPQELELPWAYEIRLQQAHGRPQVLDGAVLAPDRSRTNIDIDIALPLPGTPNIKIEDSLQSKPGQVQAFLLDIERHPAVVEHATLKQAKSKRFSRLVFSTATTAAGLAFGGYGLGQLGKANELKAEAETITDPEDFTEFQTLTAKVELHNRNGTVTTAIGGGLLAVGLGYEVTFGSRHRRTVRKSSNAIKSALTESISLSVLDTGTRGSHRGRTKKGADDAFDDLDESLDEIWE